MGIEGRDWHHRRSGLPLLRTKLIPKLKLKRPRALSRWVQSQENLPFKTFRSLIETLGEFRMVTDPDGRVGAIWNSFGSTERFQSRCLLNCRLNEIVDPHLMIQISDLARRTAILACPGEIQCQANLFGMTRWFSVSAAPLDGYGSNCPVMCLVARDVTRKKQAVTELVEREALLASAEQAANFGTWELDLKTKKVRISPQLMKIYEIESAEDWSVDMYWERMHPDDRARLRRNVEKSLEAGQAGDYVARYCAPGGRVRVHLVHTLPLPDENGQVNRLVNGNDVFQSLGSDLA